MIDNNQIFKHKDMINLYQYYTDLIRNQEFDDEE